MQAKVKDSYRFPTAMAFAGNTYVKGNWHNVPENGTAEALRRMNDPAEAQLEFKLAESEQLALLAEENTPQEALPKGAVGVTMVTEPGFSEESAVVLNEEPAPAVKPPFVGKNRPAVPAPKGR